MMTETKTLSRCPKCGREPGGLRDEQGCELHCCGISSGLQNGDTNACEAWDEAVARYTERDKPLEIAAVPQPEIVHENVDPSCGIRREPTQRTENKP